MWHHLGIRQWTETIVYDKLTSNQPEFGSLPFSEASLGIPTALQVRRLAQRREGACQNSHSEVEMVELGFEPGSVPVFLCQQWGWLGGPLRAAGGWGWVERLPAGRRLREGQLPPGLPGEHPRSRTAPWWTP